MASSKKSGGKKPGTSKRAKSPKPAKGQAAAPGAKAAPKPAAPSPAPPQTDVLEGEGSGFREGEWVDARPSRARTRVEDQEWLKALKARATYRRYSVSRTDARIELGRYYLAVSGKEYRAAGLLRDVLGISRRAATDYVTAGKKRSRRDNDTPIEARRSELRERARETYQSAMDHHKPVTVGDGMGLAHVEMWPEPNEAAALKALEFEARLDGLNLEKPPAAEVSVNVHALQVYQQVYGIAPMLDVPALPAERAPVPPITADVEVGP